MLSTEHLTEITSDSAVAADVAGARGYRTLTGEPADRDLLSGLGFKPFVWDRDDAYPGLLVPTHDARGEQNGVQYKPAVPRVRTRRDQDGGVREVPVKYESPSGAPLVVDVPHFTRDRLGDLSTPLWITEGMKKTDSLVTQGLAALGLTGVFNWRSKLGTLGDWEDIPIKGRPMVLCFDADAAINRNVQLAMSRLGGWLKSRGASKVHYIVVPDAVNGRPVKGVDDFFAAGGTVEALAAAQLDTPPGTGAVDASFTDAFLVESLASEALEGKYAYAPGLGWLRWTGKVWKGVSEIEPVEAVRQWATGRFDAVLAEQSKDRSKNLTAQINGWRGVLSRSRITALAALARGVDSIQVDATEMDADPDLLTVRNGTVHLPSGELRAHDPADFITKIANASYRPGHRDALWDKALQAIPDPATAEWYQDRMGQGISGYKTPDHVMVISYGDGQNGKSTITGAVLETLGTEQYACLVSDRILTASPSDHPTELMDLRGARYAALEELPEARQLNVQRIKLTLGTPSITARKIRQDPVTFPATHSLFINTNHKPTIHETDHGTWRRLALMPWPLTFRKTPAEVLSPDDRLGDPRLEYASQDESFRDACLLWLAEGARRWYARSRVMLPIPPQVAEATQKWRGEVDVVIPFVAERLVFEPDAFTPSAEMLTAFNEFLDECGHRPWNDKTLGGRMGTHELIKRAGVDLKRKSVGGRQQRGWCGVRVLKDPNPFV